MLIFGARRGWLSKNLFSISLYCPSHLHVLILIILKENWPELTHLSSWSTYFTFFKCATHLITGTSMRSNNCFWITLIKTFDRPVFGCDRSRVLVLWCGVFGLSLLSGSVPFSVPVTDFPTWSIYLAGGSAAICSTEGSRAPHAPFTHTQAHTFCSLKDTHAIACT